MKTKMKNKIKTTLAGLLIAPLFAGSLTCKYYYKPEAETVEETLESGDKNSTMNQIIGEEIIEFKDENGTINYINKVEYLQQGFKIYMFGKDAYGKMKFSGDIAFSSRNGVVVREVGEWKEKIILKSLDFGMVCKKIYDFNEKLKENPSLDELVKEAENLPLRRTYDFNNDGVMDALLIDGYDGVRCSYDNGEMREYIMSNDFRDYMLIRKTEDYFKAYDILEDGSLAEIKNEALIDYLSFRFMFVEAIFVTERAGYCMTMFTNFDLIYRKWCEKYQK